MAAACSLAAFQSKKQPWESQFGAAGLLVSRISSLSQDLFLTDLIERMPVLDCREFGRWGETHIDGGADFDTTPTLSIRLMPVCSLLFYFGFCHSLPPHLLVVLWFDLCFPMNKLISVVEARSRRELIYAQIVSLFLQPLHHKWNKKKAVSIPALGT